MKFKKLTKNQILISLDRLTRFKNTKQKYLRVFVDILVENLLEPKYKKKELENLEKTILADYASQIINSSLECVPDDFYINGKIKEYENSIFNNDEEIQKLLDNKINYKAAIKLITQKDTINLRWLKTLDKNINHAENRKINCLKFPLEKIILAEGITEEILLPAFSRLLGHDFYSEGVHIIGAGGKNQVVKMYYELSEELKLPIFILLDKDAEENIRQIKPKLREIDKIHLVSCGEFEDLLPKNLIVKTVNNQFRNFISINENDLDKDLPTAKILEIIFKNKCLYEFKKADFAKEIMNNLASEDDISAEIKDIIEEIFKTN